MRPIVAQMASNLSEDCNIPDACLISLIFKIDQHVRKSFHLQPNITVRCKQLFRDFWKKLIDQEQGQTDTASIPITYFGKHEQSAIAVAERNTDQSDTGDDSVVKLSHATESDITVLPEEVCIVSLGSSQSPEKYNHQQKAVKHRQKVQDQ